MKREIESLTEGTFDLLVVGGGIYGAWSAYDAALRGLRVALVEQRDWASGTSSNSSKLIHGGLRYLEYRRFGLVRKALHERNRLRRLGPHRVRRMRFAIPLYHGGRLLRWKLRLGLKIYDLFARSGHPMRGHESLSAQRMAKRYGFLKTDGLHAGFTYGDCQTDDARYTLEIVAGALAAGAVAVNHAVVRRLTAEGGAITGALVGPARRIDADRTRENDRVVRWGVERESAQRGDPGYQARNPHEQGRPPGHAPAADL